MGQSLSIVLPVHNAQASLSSQVHHLLDVLPELSREFEVLIVDDGSTDHTDEVAADLAVAYPQVRTARHRRQQGISAAVRTGLARTTGDIIFVHDEETPLSPADLRRLWEMRGDDELVMARAEPQIRPQEGGLIGRLMAWGAALKKPAATGENGGGMQMIRRQAIDELLAEGNLGKGLSLARSARTDKVTRGPIATKAPNFLSRVKDFATGE